MGAAADRLRRLRRGLRKKAPLHAPGAPRTGPGRGANRATVAPRRCRAARCSALARARGPARRARARQTVPCRIPCGAEPLRSHLPAGPAGQPDAAIPERSRCTTDGERPRAAAQGIARRLESQGERDKISPYAARFDRRPLPLAPVPESHQAARGVLGRVLRGHRHVPRRSRHGAAEASARRDYRHLARGRRGGGGELPGRAEDRRGHDAHSGEALAPRGAHVASDACVRRRSRRHRAVDAVRPRQSAHHVADLRHVHRLRSGVHGLAQAHDPAEHRDRRSLRGDAAGARLGGGHRTTRPRGAASVPYHFRVDPAAFLGARALSHPRFRQGRAADAAGHARAPLNAAVRAALHADSVRLSAAPFRLRHERLDLSRRGSRFERSLLGLRSAPLCELQRFARAAHLPLFDRVPRGALRRAARRSSSFRVSSYLRTWVGLVFAACALAGCGGSGPSFKNTDITGADYGKDFALTDHTGKTRTLADFRGKAVVMFFGYTRCPDVCPTTLAELKAVKEQLGEDGKRLQVLFVTVDPERDTQKLLANYVPAFDPSFLGLYGDSAATARVAKDFRVFYQKSPGKTPDSYTVDHTAGSYVFDPQGRLRLFARHGNAANLIADIRTLLRTSG